MIFLLYQFIIYLLQKYQYIQPIIHSQIFKKAEIANITNENEKGNYDISKEYSRKKMLFFCIDKFIWSNRVKYLKKNDQCKRKKRLNIQQAIKKHGILCILYTYYGKNIHFRSAYGIIFVSWYIVTKKKGLYINPLLVFKSKQRDNICL
jgi:hypothetical protein